MYLSWSDTIIRQLQDIDGHPALIAPLAGLIQRDLMTLERGGHWGWVIPQVQQALGDPNDLTGPFRVAWGLMYSVSRRLDQIQDQDPTDDPLPGSATSAHYTLVLAYYVLSQGLLSQLNGEAIPPMRALRLQQLWSDLMLRTASGQYADLLSGEPGLLEQSADNYQRIIHAKTGSAFALAFAGVGALLRDDDAQIQALLAIGDFFGALIQYGDDIVDQEEQPNTSLTLPRIFANEPRSTGAPLHQLAASIYSAHQERLAELLQAFPTPTSQALLAIFTRAFEHPRA